jgi:hypothetical protein
LIVFHAELDQFIRRRGEPLRNVLFRHALFAKLDENGTQRRDLDPFVPGDLRRKFVQPFVDRRHDCRCIGINDNARRRRGFFLFLVKVSEDSPSSCDNGRDPGANRAESR